MAFVFRGCFINTLALPTKHHKKVLKSQYIFLYGNVENLGTLCYTRLRFRKMNWSMYCWIMFFHLPDQILAVYFSLC